MTIAVDLGRKANKQTKQTWLSENEQQKKSCLFLHFLAFFLLGCHLGLYDAKKTVL